MSRSWLILADGYLTARNAKTAHGVIRYSRDRIAAVIDRDNAGASLAEVMPELNSDAPIVGSVAEGLQHAPTTLLLGVATPGGWMPEHWRSWITEAIEAGLEVVNGLHQFLRDDPEFVRLAKDHNVRLWDVREPPTGIPLFSGKSLEVPQRVMLTVGSDCAVGKKTTAIEIAAAANADGVKAEFLATGQTGIMIAGKGIAVDRVVADFVAGAAETLVCETDPGTDVVVVEGQGSLWHPAYSGVTLGLLHGSAPEILILCHEAGRTAIEEPPFTKLPSLTEMIATYENLASFVRVARVACISLNCKGLDDEAAANAIAAVARETGRPTGDVARGHAPALWAAARAALQPPL